MPTKSHASSTAKSARKTKPAKKATAPKAKSTAPKAKALFSANDHAMKLLASSAVASFKEAGQFSSLPTVKSCITQNTGAQNPGSYQPLGAFTTQQGVLDSIGDCINGAYGLQAPYRWRHGVIKPDWTVQELAGATDVFRAHQP